MPQFTQISTALRVASKNSSALMAGTSIVAISRTFMREGQQFALVESEFISDSQDCSLEYWASCDSVQSISGNYDSKYLSQLTHLSNDSVQELLEEKANFLAFLKVYRIPVKTQQSLQFNRQFAALTSPITVVDEFPIVSTIAFEQKKLRTQNPTCCMYPELEELQSTIDRYVQNNPKAKDFNHELQVFLGWADPQNQVVSKSENDWMQKIKAYGYRDEETAENRKSNYQAGTDFEIIIRQSLEFLGFTVDEAHAGGAGGIDVFCSAPYSLVGECKCGKGIPDSTVEQLDRIAKRHLKERYESASRFIIGPGNPSAQLLESAKLPTTSIMSPETLQKLVEFHDKYPINLIELRDKCLVAGQVDSKVDDFLKELTARISIRSHVIQSVKSLKEEGDSLVSASTVRTHFNATFAQKLKERLETPEQAHSILIELSSPLTGYLARTKCDTWRGDRFYFLRDLTV